MASLEVLLTRGQIVLDSESPRNPAWLIALMAERAEGGCQITILSHDAHLIADHLPDHPNIKIRGLEPAATYGLLRADQHMLLTLHFPDEQPTDPTPALIHLHQTQTPALFERLAQHLQDAWTWNSELLDQDEDLQEPENDQAHPEGTDEVSAPAAPKPQEQATGAGPGRPRRWPRRPP